MAKGWFQPASAQRESPWRSAEAARLVADLAAFMRPFGFAPSGAALNKDSFEEDSFEVATLSERRERALDELDELDEVATHSQRAPEGR
ncbi:MAG: hypothetical protein AAGM38_05165 [Pseudomonadota bacterium]